MYEFIDLEKELVGKTLTECYNENDEELHFVTTGGTHLKLYHRQDCCESVTIEDICGDLEDLIGSPLVEVEVVTNSDENPVGVEMEYQDESFTWTFYKFRTAKGAVTVRWYSESNGYYSEEVDVARIA